jgi:hypothetical protein
MRKILLASVALACVTVAAPAAHASGYAETCAMGDNDQVHVVYNGDTHEWAIKHTLKTGKVVYRNDQYAIADTTMVTGGLVYPRWEGAHLKVGALKMTGELVGMANGTPEYWETLTKNRNVTFQDKGACTFDSVQPTTPEVATTPPVYTPAPIPQPSAGGQVTVALYDIPDIVNGLYVNVSMGDGSVVYHMTLDTGCSDMNISKALADWLLANGHATVTRNARSHLADGSISVSRVLTIDHITLDGHTVENVEASDGAPDQNEGSMLLGLGVLKRFGKFSIDTAGHQLVLG